MSSFESYNVVFAGDKDEIHVHFKACSHSMITGGTTACVITGRLVQADPSLKILVQSHLSSTYPSYNYHPRLLRLARTLKISMIMSNQANIYMA